MLMQLSLAASRLLLASLQTVTMFDICLLPQTHRMPKHSLGKSVAYKFPWANREPKAQQNLVLDNTGFSLSKEGPGVECYYGLDLSSTELRYFRKPDPTYVEALLEADDEATDDDQENAK